MLPVVMSLKSFKEYQVKDTEPFSPKPLSFSILSPSNLTPIQLKKFSANITKAHVHRNCETQRLNAVKTAQNSEFQTTVKLLKRNYVCEYCPSGICCQVHVGLNMLIWFHFICQTTRYEGLVKLPCLPFPAWSRRFLALSYCTGSFYRASHLPAECSCLYVTLRLTRKVLKDFKKSPSPTSLPHPKTTTGFLMEVPLFSVLWWFSNSGVSESHEGLL